MEGGELRNDVNVMKILNHFKILNTNLESKN